MEMFDVFSMNEIENVILKVSQTHFSKDFYPKGGGNTPLPLGLAKGRHTFFKGEMPPPPKGGGGCEVPCKSDGVENPT